MAKKKKKKRERERRNRRSRISMIRSWIETNKELFRAYIIFVAFITVAFSALITPWGKDELLKPLNRIIAVVSVWTLGLFGTDAQARSNIIVSALASVKIKEGCNGVYATMIFLAGIVAYPTSLIKKVIGVILGTAALFAVNLVRVLTLFYFSAYFPTVFDEAHLYIWQFAIIIIGGLFWLVWYDKIVSPSAAEKSV
jgi:exosortase H (IPTLxxWG-CTERM-specific)